MRSSLKYELYTQNKRRVIMYRLNNQRYRLALRKELNPSTIVLILNDYFPGLVFIPKNNSDISILNYIIQKEDKWTLDIYAMSKSREKIYSSLFPENISKWNETEARKKYDCADIIRFFIDKENDIFSAELSKISEIAHNRGKNISSRFLDELDYNGKPVWEDWDFSALVLHKMRRRPPNIYEAFGYYARRRYTLMGLGLGISANSDCNDDELLKSGIKLLDNAIREQIPETADYKGDLLTGLFEMIQETLESVPTGSSLYTPSELSVIINQIKMRIAGLFRNSYSENNENLYNAADRKTINNHIQKAQKLPFDDEILSELNNARINGSYSEKINLLHRIALNTYLTKHYSKRELDIIHGLFLKQYRHISLDNTLGDDEADNSYSYHDITGDDKYISAEDNLAWSLFFRNEFAGELNKDALEKFIEYLPDHFSRLPFDFDENGDLFINKYSKKILFKVFCSIAGIQQDIELQGQFNIILRRVIDNINKIRNE